MSETGKILRIGVIQNGKVIEERKIPRRVTVTVGSDASNDFVVQGGGVPATWPLFELKGNQYELVFTESMTGHVNVGDDKVLLNKVRSDGLAEAAGDKFRYGLNDSSRGRVQLGKDVSILFHFTKPAVAAAQAQLPASVATGMLANVDKIFSGILTASFLIHAVFMLMVIISKPSVEPPSREDVLKYIARVKPPKVEIKKPDPVADTKGNDDTKKPEKKKPEKKADDGAKGKPKKGKGGDKGDRRRAVRQAVAGKALAAIIGSAASGSSSSVGRVFGEGSSIGGDLENAIKGTEGVGVAGSGSDITRRGGGDGDGGDAAGLDDGDLKTSGGKRVSGGKKTVARVRGSAKVGEVAPIDGTVDKRGVSRAIRRRQAAFQQCYENALKSNSKLKGKLVVEFTINRRGRVSEAAVIRDGLGSTAVSRCVIGVLKRVRFPAPDDGSVTISNSFVFQPNG